MVKSVKTPQPLKGSSVWSEVQTYVKNVFEALPEDERTVYRVSTDQLISGLENEFKGKYDAQEVATLLKNGFELEPGIYQFGYNDFKVINTPVAYTPQPNNR